MTQIKVGDLVKVKEKYIYPNQDVLILPYNAETVGLVIRVEDAGYIFDSEINKSGGVGSSVWGKYITVRWSGMNTSLMPIDSEYQHMEQELDVVSAAKEENDDT